MIARVVSTLTTHLVALFLLSPLAQAAPPAVITMDGAYLELAKSRVASGDAALKPAFDKLLTDASATLALPPESVTYKKIVPPSGNKQDYLSLPPYWCCPRGFAERATTGFCIRTANG
jgi:hypothetical protein